MDDLLRDMLNANAEIMKSGIKAGREMERIQHRAALMALQREFQQSLLDPESKIKSSLQVAILATLAPLTEEQTNAYANAMVKKDQLARHEGRDDHDRTTRGDSLKDAA